MRITIDWYGENADIGFGTGATMMSANYRKLDVSDLVRLFHQFLSWHPPLTVLEFEMEILQKAIKETKE